MSKAQAFSEFAEGNTCCKIVLLPPSAVPHISQEKCFGTFPDSFSPRGEALSPYPQLYVLPNLAEIYNKGFSIVGEAGNNRLFGTDF